MAELDNGVKKLLITDKNSVNNAYQPQFITDEERALQSSKEVYFRYNFTGIFPLRVFGYFPLGAGNYCRTIADYFTK